MKDNFVIHNSLYEPIEHLSDEQLGRLFRALFQYSINGSTKVDNDIQIAFNFFKMHIDFSNEKYQEVCEKRSDAGRKGAEKRWNGKNSKNSKCYNAMANDSKAINDMAKMGRIDKNRIDKINNTPLELYNSEDKSSSLSNSVPPNGEVATEVAPLSQEMKENFSSKPSEEKNKEKVAPKEKRKFVKPTVEEVAEYCRERGNAIIPESFVNFYESKGWVIGKSPMKDWKAAIRTWEQKIVTPQAPLRKEDPHSIPIIQHGERINSSGQVRLEDIFTPQKVL